MTSIQYNAAVHYNSPNYRYDGTLVIIERRDNMLMDLADLFRERRPITAFVDDERVPMTRPALSR